MTTPIRVIVADDQEIVRDGLVAVLGLAEGIVVVGDAADGEAAVALAVREHPDVALLDLRMPRLDGAGATARLARDAPQVAVLVLTTYADDDSIRIALRAGARGYLTKDAGREQIVAAIRAVAAGQRTFGPEVADRLVEALAAKGAVVPTQDAAGILLARFPVLTRREAEVLALIAEGQTNAEICRALFIEMSTVKSYVNAIFAKLGVRNRAQAMLQARL